MRRIVVLFGVIGTATIAHAQSRADQVPPSRPNVQLPLAPAPSDEETKQPAQAVPSPEIVASPAEPPSKLVPASIANDTLSRHLLLSAGISLTNAFGSLDSQTSLPGTVAAGYNLGVGVGYGLSRYVEGELRGSLSSFGSASECPSCSSRSYALTGAVRYHLVQGVRFDPWIRAGIGVSAFRLNEATGKRNYLGLQWLSATLGGDWYATRNFGFGPTLALALTSYFDHPRGANTSIAAQWLVGLNFTFDTTGK